MQNIFLLNFGAEPDYFFYNFLGKIIFLNPFTSEGSDTLILPFTSKTGQSVVQNYLGSTSK